MTLQTIDAPLAEEPSFLKRIIASIQIASIAFMSEVPRP